MFDPSDLPPVGTENVTVVHQRGDRHVTTVGTLTEVDDQLHGYTVWLSVPAARPIDVLDYPIDSHRIVSVDPTCKRIEQRKAAEELAEGLVRLAGWVGDHPDVVARIGGTVPVEVTVYGEADRARELTGNDEGVVDFGGGVVLTVYAPQRVTA